MEVMMAMIPDTMVEVPTMSLLKRTIMVILVERAVLLMMTSLQVMNLFLSVMLWTMA